MASGEDTVLVVLPMFHAFAATVGLLTPLLHGCAVAPCRRFEPELVARASTKPAPLSSSACLACSPCCCG